MILRKAMHALALAAGFGCAPEPALAEAPGANVAPCAPYAELAEMLRRRFGEALRFGADDARGFALEFFAHPDGNWTLVMRRGGRACAIAAGARWTDRPRDENAF